VNSIIDSFDKSSLPGLFGACDVGECSWWDYGQLQLYRAGSLLLTEATEDAKLCRAFFGITEDSRITASTVGDCSIDAASVISGSSLKSGTVAACAVASVTAGEVQAEGAVLVQVSAKKIVAGKGSIAYNVIDTSEEGLVLAENEVRVGVCTLDDERPYLQMSSSAETDGGKAWKEKVHGNPKSFEDVYNMNKGVDVSACAAVSKKLHGEFLAAAGLS